MPDNSDYAVALTGKVGDHIEGLARSPAAVLPRPTQIRAAAARRTESWLWNYLAGWWRCRCMRELNTAQVEYLASQRLGRIATAGVDHKPHVVPTSFRYNPDLGTIDAGGMHVATTKKYRDVEANGWAAIVVDDLASIDPWQPRMLEIRGRAEAIPYGGEELGPGFGAAFIRIYPDKVNSYGIT
jgi:pyridoxamine 5'-phosphate oxidase family protein